MQRLILRFKDFKPKALTLSYDDGVEQDIKLIKIMNKCKKEKPAEEPKPIEIPEDIKLLTEIRDLLKKETKKK